MRWNSEVYKRLQQPDVRARLQGAGLEIVGGTDAYVREVLLKDIDTWKKVVKAADIKL